MMTYILGKGEKKVSILKVSFIAFPNLIHTFFVEVLLIYILQRKSKSFYQKF